MNRSRPQTWCRLSFSLRGSRSMFHVSRYLPMTQVFHGADSCAVPKAILCLAKSSCSLSFFFPVFLHYKCLSVQAAVTENHRLSGLTVCCLQFWRLEGQDPGASMVRAFLLSLRAVCSLFPHLMRAEIGCRLSRVSSYKHTNSIHGIMSKQNEPTLFCFLCVCLWLASGHVKRC